MKTIIPIIPPAIDGWTTRRVAARATATTTSAPARSAHGVRLKNIHHAMIPSEVTIAPMMPNTSVSGTKAGMTNLISTSSAARTTPGHRRSGLRRGAWALCCVDMSVGRHDDFPACVPRLEVSDGLRDLAQRAASVDHRTMAFMWTRATWRSLLMP